MQKRKKRIGRKSKFHQTLKSQFTNASKVNLQKYKAYFCRQMSMISQLQQFQNLDKSKLHILTFQFLGKLTKVPEKIGKFASSSLAETSCSPKEAVRTPVLISLRPVESGAGGSGRGRKRGGEGQVHTGRKETKE